MIIYVIQPNDTLGEIATEYDSTISELSYINQIPDPYRLAVGQAILIPSEEPQEDRRVVKANGYAYPFIARGVLDETLDFLSDLFVFSYGFTTAGELIPPLYPDQEMLLRAAAKGVDSILVLTPLGEDGRFNNNLISTVLRDEVAKENLIQNVIDTMLEKGFQGVDVDFEYILAQDRDLFTQFVGELRMRVNAIGGRVSVALAPKSSAGQPGLLYEGKDYRGLGEAADEVLLMTYEWGYTYGPAMAVAPINKVRPVIEYALTEIPAEKINMGIPNYGYDWTLPYVQGESRAVTIGNVEAVQIAIENNALIQFDEIAQSPFFQYERDGRTHEVWFEDVRSIQQKYNLIKEYNLRGFGVWQIMRLYRAMWYLREDNFRIYR